MSSVKLTGNFLATARCLIFADSSTGVWSFNSNTNTLTISAAGGLTGLASPSASVGLTAINGTATTALRSDGAPALSVAIVPTWTGLHTFGAGLTVTTGQPLTVSGYTLVLTATASVGGTNTGDQTSVSGSSGSCTGNAATATTATNVAYSGLTGSVPTWNQNTSGSSASCTGNAATATTAGACSGNSATATSATTATNVTGGLAGSLPYQTGAGATTTLAIGLAGKYLTVNAGATAPQWTALPAYPSSANPSASVGLSAVNGTATTFMTSDSAPALSVAITPTWTGLHTWTLAGQGIQVNNTSGSDTIKVNSTATNGVLTRYQVNGTDMGYIGSAKECISGSATDLCVTGSTGQLVLGGGATIGITIGATGVPTFATVPAFTQVGTATATTVGGVALAALAKGFITVTVAGVNYGVPYFTL